MVEISPAAFDSAGNDATFIAEDGKAEYLDLCRGTSCGHVYRITGDWTIHAFVRIKIVSIVFCFKLFFPDSNIFWTLVNIFIGIKGVTCSSSYQ